MIFKRLDLEIFMNFAELDASLRGVPDIFTFNDGSAVKDASDFERRRAELRELLCEHEYGIIPPRPDHFSVAVTNTDKTFCAGKADLLTLKLTVEIGEASFSFPVYSVIPNRKGKHPAFLHINFRPDVPDRYMPSEEIVDRGYAIFSFCYISVQSIKNQEVNYRYNNIQYKRQYISRQYFTTIRVY